MFEGGVGVADYWKGICIGFAINASLFLLNLILRIVPSSFFVPAFIFYLILVLPYLVFAVASLGLTVRRLHDLNLSGWWSLIPLMFYIFRLTPETFLSMSVLYHLLPVYTLVFIGFFIYFSFFPGKPINNKFGSPMKYSSWLNAYLGNKAK